ncbi:hypothetical protein SO802_012588 [Lithocarpus litseifolius]|uniref:Uncharacterized protein n=1 Tax=Lithocarpus litseifolius TaxID=425828 RepID=A0AAW2D5B6_9ROSI
MGRYGWRVREGLMACQFLGLSEPELRVLDELDKLCQPLAQAIAEELSLSTQRLQLSPSDSAFDDIETNNNHNHDDNNNNNNNYKSTASSFNEWNQNDESDPSLVEDLLNLLYFGSLFDVKSQGDFTTTMLTRTHVRGCCLSYDYVTDDATDLLGERDLEKIKKKKKEEEAKEDEYKDGMYVAQDGKERG